jgi:hypothetical protein
MSALPRTFSVGLCIAGLACLQPSLSLAQCPGPCGDLNASGSLTSSDLNLMLDWIFHQLPPPQPIACADIDHHQEVTLYDASLLMETFFNCDESFFCEPSLPPHVPVPTDAYLIYYDDRFPANDSQATFDLMYVDRGLESYARALDLPLLSDVSGQVPDVEVLDLDPDGGWDLDRQETQVQGAPPGHLLLGFIDAGVPPSSGRLARLRLSVPVSGVDRSIHLQWTALQPHNLAMVMEPACLFGPPFEPRLLPCWVHATGDLEENDGVSSSDIILTINFVFKGGLPPLPCTAAADVDCSGNVTSADIIRLVNHVFKGGAAPCDVCELVADGVWACP